MKISIVIAAYNVEKFIEKCIYSCVRQKLDKSLYEIVVVNDGSKDDTPKILNKLEEQIENLHIFHQENSGLGASRNKGLLNCKGEFVWFIDGDDYIEENVLQEIVGKLDQKSLDVLVLNYAVVNDSYKIISSQSNQFVNVTGVTSGAAYFRYNSLKSYSWLFVVKRSLYLENKLKFKERINMQDAEIHPKILFYAKQLSFFDKDCYYYVQHSKSYTNSENGEVRYNYFKSIIEVTNSLKHFMAGEASENDNMTKGIQLKLEAIDNIVFSQLAFFNFDKYWLKKIIKLLKESDLYPLKFKSKGKMKLIKIGLNNYPFFTKDIIRLIKKNKRT